MNQTYLLRKLETNRGTIDFDGNELQAQLIPLNPEACLILITNPQNALEGLTAPWNVRGVGGQPLIEEIRYQLSATDGDDETVYEEFKHTFTTPVRLRSFTTPEGYGHFSQMQTENGNALFIPYQLDVLLGTKNKFPKVTAVQFIA